MKFFKRSKKKTNWKYILIIIILAVVVGGVLVWQFCLRDKAVSPGEEREEAAPESASKKVKDCSEFKIAQEPLDIDTLLEPPPLFPELSWHEITDAELKETWIDQKTLSYEDLSDNGSSHTVKYAEFKIEKGWSVEMPNNEQFLQVLESLNRYYYNELEKSGWSWEVIVHGFEIHGLSYGGPMGTTDGFLKVKNGYLREIILDERRNKFNVFISDIVALKDIVPQYSSEAYLGIRHWIITPEVQQEKNLSVDYGALIYPIRYELEPAVVSGSPAEKAGLKKGDIILTINKQRIDKDHMLHEIIEEKYCPGEEVILRVLSDGEERDVSVILGEY